MTSFLGVVGLLMPLLIPAGLVAVCVFIARDKDRGVALAAGLMVLAVFAAFLIFGGG